MNNNKGKRKGGEGRGREGKGGGGLINLLLLTRRDLLERGSLFVRAAEKRIYGSIVKSEISFSCVLVNITY